MLLKLKLSNFWVLQLAVISNGMLTLIIPIISKCSRRIFYIICCKRFNCNRDILWNLYYAFIRSIITYCFPAFCNLNSFLFTKLSKIEKRVALIIGCNPNICLKRFCENICIKLFHCTNNNINHRLGVLFLENNSGRITRSSKKLLMPYCRSSRSSNHFIKFCL